MSDESILVIDDVHTEYPVRGGFLGLQRVGSVHAVRGVSVSVRRGETLGLVGESGCGKSTLARTIVGLEQTSRGRIFFEGVDITRASARERRAYRRNLQLVFQNPYGALDPRMSIGRSLAEPLRAYRVGDKSEVRRRVSQVLERVGLDPSYATRYPHELSGGQRQRVGIGRALVLEPKLLVLDEPVSALDVSIQAQIINLLTDLQSELGLTYIIIAHDLAVVRQIADRVAVMYLGKVVEFGGESAVYETPTHPYTKGLLSAVPSVARRGQRGQIIVEGDIPSPLNPPSGCGFRTRCWKAGQVCADEEPGLVERVIDGQLCACHFAEVGEELAAPRY